VPVDLPGRHPHSAGSHHVRRQVEPRRLRHDPAQFANARRARRRPPGAVRREHRGHAQRAVALRPLRCA
jgi:hypothetical protein